VRLVTRLVACAFATAVTAGALAAPAYGQETFTITGAVEGLYPGATATLVAKVTNPHPFAIRVTSVGATTVSGGACPPTMLTVTGSTTEVVIQPGATGDVPLTVHMDSTADDVCQGATFTLAFNGTAAEAAGASASGMPVTGIAIGGLVATGTALISIGLAVRRRARLGLSA